MWPKETEQTLRECLKEKESNKEMEDNRRDNQKRKLLVESLHLTAELLDSPKVMVRPSLYAAVRKLRDNVIMLDDVGAYNAYILENGPVK